MQRCDLCGLENEPHDLSVHSAEKLRGLVKSGFKRGVLEMQNSAGAETLRNKEAFDKTARSKWNLEDDWLLCGACSQEIRKFKNLRRAAAVIAVLGFAVIGLAIYASVNVVLIVLGAILLTVAGGLAAATVTQPPTEQKSWEEQLESLRNVKVTPAMIEYAKAELRKEVPNLLVQLQDTRPEKRASAAEILGTAGDNSKSVVSALINALNDADFRVQTNAAVSLNELKPDWTKSVDATTMAPKLASAIIDNKHALDHKKRRGVIDAIEKMDSARGAGLRMLLEFEQGIDSAVKQSAMGQSLNLEPQSLNMEDKLTLLLSQMGQDSKQTVSVSDSPFAHVTGKSLFYRCPSCNVLLRKRSVEGLPDAIGTTSCSECKASFSYSDVYYDGRYDVPEVEGKCPTCAAALRGPADDLLGKPCPSCNAMLPAKAR